MNEFQFVNGELVLIRKHMFSDERDQHSAISKIHVDTIF
jgi:hypothetical protein